MENNNSGRFTQSFFKGLWYRILWLFTGIEREPLMRRFGIKSIIGYDEIANNELKKWQTELRKRGDPSTDSDKEGVRV